MPRKAATATDVKPIEMPKEPPANNPGDREDQLISLAYMRAEEMLRNGTAPPMIVAHFLKMGSTRERIEKEILAKQADLYQAKTEAYSQSKDAKELLEKAISAFTAYKGEADPDEYDELKG